jgi:dynein heavy chain
MEKLSATFQMNIEKLKGKNHELLDSTSNKFDRDFVEFNVEISHLD